MEHELELASYRSSGKSSDYLQLGTDDTTYPVTEACNILSVLSGLILFLQPHPKKVCHVVYASAFVVVADWLSVAAPTGTGISMAIHTSMITDLPIIDF